MVLLAFLAVPSQVVTISVFKLKIGLFLIHFDITDLWVMSQFFDVIIASRNDFCRLGFVQLIVL